jgi:ribonuclease R
MKKTKKKAIAPEEIATVPTKENKLFQNLLKITEQFISGKNYQGLTLAELSDRLKIPELHEDIFKKILHTLLTSGFAEMDGERYIVKKLRSDVVKGLLHMHPRGFGFLQAEDQTLHPIDVFIPKHLTLNAVHGDIVEVVINLNAISDKGPEGKVVAILKRARTHMGGIIKAIDREGILLAYAPMLGIQQRVIIYPTEDFTLKVGDRIVMEVKEWGSKDTETICAVSHYIGHISDPSCDIKAAIEEYEIRSDFPTEVLDQALGFGKVVSQKDIEGREDFRNLVTLTIDPDTAKDFDDAISLTKDSQGNYHLGVHIADVSHYVKPGSALDLEAAERCNSTYFPGVCIPMLPSALSNNLCSLKPQVNRLTASILMDFDPQGNLISHRISKSVIKSAKRFTYKEAKLVLDGKKKSIHEDALKLMVELCGHLKRKRYERGSIEFAIPELAIIVDENGVPTHTDYIEYDITHQLVEEFMLKANEMVATHLSKLSKGLTYRIHDVPAEDNMKDFSVLASAFGFNLSDIPTPQELQKLFEEAKSTAYGEYLATSYIRKMRLAIYSADNIGHYGLGLTHYCHFTSPIRRYVDLVVHRILFGDDMSNENIAAVAEKCSDQERISAKAEGSVVLLKKLRLLQTIHEKEPKRQYEAVVTKIKNFGVYFEILEFMLESFLHVSELEDDYYVYDDKKQELKGRRSGSSFFSGDKITVMLSSLDFITRESTWSLVCAEKNENEMDGGYTREKRSKKPHKKKPKIDYVARRKEGSRDKKVKIDSHVNGTFREKAIKEKIPKEKVDTGFRRSKKEKASLREVSASLTPLKKSVKKEKPLKTKAVKKAREKTLAIKSEAIPKAKKKKSIKSL